MLNTRIPVDRLVDWIDQALLYIRVDDATTNHTIEGKDVEFAGDRTTLRKYGIRSATDLLDVLKDKERGKDFVGLLNHDAGLPSRMQALEIALQGEAQPPVRTAVEAVRGQGGSRTRVYRVSGPANPVLRPESGRPTRRPVPA
jgi:hypothetical protein